MSSEQERGELDARARQGETVVPGGTRGKSLEGQERLAVGRSRGGQTRQEQIGHEGYQDMGRKGGLSTTDKSGGERAAQEGIPIDESQSSKLVVVSNISQSSELLLGFGWHVGVAYFRVLML